MSNPWACECVERELRTRQIEGGGIQYVRQCLRCGRAGQAIKHAEIASLKTLPPRYDELLPDRFSAQAREAALALRASRAEAVDLEEVERNTAYEAYLESAQWKRKVAQVMQRQRYICQGCMESRASVVHHLTYAHIGRELLFELVALCDPCHELAHSPKVPLEALDYQR